ncbi:hypothetical protein WR25_21484 [Diploscapter pachys]|uniref:Uncharacterized protein n=1 Tax=Diploscapter pachys TaxID=2018661 RepID=A0A2A2LXR5_9BILA|nr:hypothetical protein WR25_21484 [Diploscapter pachys]
MVKVKVCIKLVDDSSVESKTLSEIVPEGTTLKELIEKKVTSVGWTNKELIVKSAQLYDEDFKQFVDITEPFDSLVLLNMQRFEVHLNKAEPKMDIILADISINETVQQGQKLVLPSDSTVNDFILAVVSTFCKDATDTAVNSVNYFDPDFNEFIDIEKPFENVPILFQHRYSISIVYAKMPINLNSDLHDMESKLPNEVQILLNGVDVHLTLISKTNCIIWVEMLLKHINTRIELMDREVFKSCLCFDPSAPVDSRISQIADMNYPRYNHSLVVANGKLYAIGG